MWARLKVQARSGNGAEQETVRLTWGVATIMGESISRTVQSSYYLPVGFVNYSESQKCQVVPAPVSNCRQLGFSGSDVCAWSQMPGWLSLANEETAVQIGDRICLPGWGASGSPSHPLLCSGGGLLLLPHLLPVLSLKVVWWERGSLVLFWGG